MPRTVTATVAAPAKADCGWCGADFEIDSMKDYLDNRGQERLICKTCEPRARLAECSDCDSISVICGNDQDNGVLCYNCSRSYRRCNDCSVTYHIDEGCNCEEDNEYGPNDDGVYDHEYKPTPRFFGQPKNGRYFGVELEVEVVEGNIKESARKIKSKLADFVYLKYDGSINHGFEIVTHPASLYESKKRFAEALAEPITTLRSQQTTTCGCHIHVSREPLHGLTIPKIISFINNPENALYLKRLAQRGSTNYSVLGNKDINCLSFKKTRTRISQPKVVEDAFWGKKTVYEPRKINAPYKHDDNGRYAAINIQNSKTIEFRLFKGSLNPEAIHRYLEFCDALCEYSYPSSRSLKDFRGYQSFIKFVDSQNIYHDNKVTKQYPALVKFHATKGPFNS